MDPDSPTSELPPPAYDAQEFDRKMSMALDRSMDPALQTVEEEWEEWNDERFEVAATFYKGNDHHHRPSSVSRQNSKKSSQFQSQNNSVVTQSSSSSQARSRTLPLSPHKERPSWYTQAHLHSPATPPHHHHHHHHHHNIPLEDDDLNVHDEPLPPFAPVGPSLEGPPYPSYPSYPPPPGSPRSSYQSTPSPPAPQRRPINHPSFRSRPSPSSNIHSSTSHMPPMPFDPGLAYARQRQTAAFMSREDDSGPVDPALLYNSAVTSVMKKSKALVPLKKTLPTRDRFNDSADRRSFDSQSTRSSYTGSSLGSYQGSSHVPRVAQYAIPSLPTLPTHQSLPSDLPILPTLQIDDPNSRQSYYTHSNASQWSQTASSYGRIA